MKEELIKKFKKRLEKEREEIEKQLMEFAKKGKFQEIGKQNFPILMENLEAEL
jgi:RNA polymerase-binding transcription factor DksA